MHQGSLAGLKWTLQLCGMWCHHLTSPRCSLFVFFRLLLFLPYLSIADVFERSDTNEPTLPQIINVIFVIKFLFCAIQYFESSLQKNYHRYRPCLICIKAYLSHKSFRGVMWVVFQEPVNSWRRRTIPTLHTDPSSWFVFIGEVLSLVTRGDAAGVNGAVCGFYFIQFIPAMQLMLANQLPPNIRLMFWNTNRANIKSRYISEQTFLLHLCCSNY